MLRLCGTTHLCMLMTSFPGWLPPASQVPPVAALCRHPAPAPATALPPCRFMKDKVLGEVLRGVTGEHFRELWRSGGIRVLPGRSRDGARVVQIVPPR